MLYVLEQSLLLTLLGSVASCSVAGRSFARLPTHHPSITLRRLFGLFGGLVRRCDPVNLGCNVLSTDRLTTGRAAGVFLWFVGCNERMSELLSQASS